MGNKAVYGLNFLHQAKLSDLPGISFSMKLDAPATLEQVYINYVVSRDCDGSGWMNLVTLAKDMTPSTTDSNGYATYTAAPSEGKWTKTGKPFPETGVAVVNGAGGSVTSLDALISAFPNACLYNYPHPAADGGVTPAVMFNLGSTGNTTEWKYWVKDIKVGDKVVF